MRMRRLNVVAFIGVSALTVACGSAGLTAPQPSPAVAPSPAPGPVLPPTSRPIDEVIAEGTYTMTIDIDQACALPASLKPLTYELNVQYGSLPFAPMWTTEKRPNAVTGSVNSYSFLKWNTTLQAEDDFDFGRCAQSDSISDPPLSVCGVGFLYRTATGYAADITGGASIGERSCGSRHRITLTPRR